MSNITPRVALITGAAKRIGRSIAQALASDGWQIAVHYRSSSTSADELVSEILAAGGSAVALQADLAEIGGVERLLPDCVRKLGPPTCLINNASEFEYDRVGSIAADTWSSHIDTNLRAPVMLAQAFAQHLPDLAQGNVVNIIDQRVLRPTPAFFSYTISKCALWTATRMLAQALGPRIRVNAVAPGPVLQSVHQTREEFEAECASTLLQHGTSEAEIAAAIRFVLDAPAMTGQIITLDGGQHLTWASDDTPAPPTTRPSR